MKKWTVTPDKFLKEYEVKSLRTFIQDKAIVALATRKKKPIRDWAIIDIAFSAGLRASEITNLKVKDIHIGRGESSLYVSYGKGNRSRLVVISDSLKKHLKRFLSWKKNIREPVDPESFLFLSQRADRMTLSAIQKCFKKWTRAAGLSSHYSIHSARHTYATMLYKKTKDLRLVQKQLGHSSSQMTEVYADVLSEDVEKAVNLLYT